MRPSGLPIKAQDLITPLNRKQKDPRFKMWCDEILEISKRGKHQED